MSVAPRRYSLNQAKVRWGILKPTTGSNGGPGNTSSQNSYEEGNNFTNTGIKKLKQPKSEKRVSIKLNMDSGLHVIKPKRNYMSLQSDELEDRNILGARKSLAMLLQLNCINYSLVVMIITYGILTFLFTSLSEDTNHNVIMPLYHSVESIFILVFVVEIVIYKYAFKEMYFHNKFNVTNCVLTGIIIIFWVLDIIVTNYSISILLRMRGVMRLVHVPVILENIKSYSRLQKGLS